MVIHREQASRQRLAKDGRGGKNREQASWQRPRKGRARVQSRGSRPRGHGLAKAGPGFTLPGGERGGDLLAIKKLKGGGEGGTPSQPHNGMILRWPPPRYHDGPMHWADFIDDRRDDTWVGLVLSPGDPALPSRPSLRVEAGAPRLIRLTAGGTPLFWARIAPDYYGYWYLQASDVAAWRSVVPPIRWSDARRIKRSPGSPGWYRAWACHFATELQRASLSPLHRGQPFLLGCAEAFLGDGGWRCEGRIRVPPVTSLSRSPARAWPLGRQGQPAPRRGVRRATPYLAHHPGTGGRSGGASRGWSSTPDTPRHPADAGASGGVLDGSLE